MSNILEILKEHKEKQKYYTSVEEASIKFKAQKDSIEKIKATPWYKAIKEFFIIQYNSSLERLKTINWLDLKELWKAQAMLEISEKFITFVESRE